MCRAGDAVDAHLLRGLNADVALTGLVDGVELEVDHDLAATVDQVGEGEIDCGQGVFRGAEDQVAGTLFNGELLDLEDLADDVAEFVHLLVCHAGDRRWSPAAGGRSVGDSPACPGR